MCLVMELDDTTEHNEECFKSLLNKSLKLWSLNPILWSRNMYTGPLDKDNVGMIECGSEGWVGQGSTMGGTLGTTVIEQQYKMFFK